MTRMDGRRPGVWSLRLDAIYCAALDVALFAVSQAVALRTLPGAQPA